MEAIKNYLVSSSNSSKVQTGSVTVKTDAGEIVARIYCDRSQPLKWLRRYPTSPERKELVQALTASGVPQEIIDAIVTFKKNKNNSCNS